MGFLLHRVVNALRHPERVPPFFLRKFKETFLWHHYYATLPEPKQIAPRDKSEGEHERILAQLRDAGVALVDCRIDVADFRAYLDRAHYHRFSDYYAGGRAPYFREKALEHYLAAKLLVLCPDDVYLDIASGRSPAADVYKQIVGCQTYRQDLTFPGARCVFSPATVSVDGQAAAEAILDVATEARSLLVPIRRGPKRNWEALPYLLPLLLLLVTLTAARALRRFPRLRTLPVPLFAVLLLCLSSLSCGSGDSAVSAVKLKGTPSGLHTIRVTASTGNQSKEITLTLQVN